MRESTANPMEKTGKAVKIEKEEIPLLSFPKEEVLKDPADRLERSRKLRMATKLGNLEKHKVRIYFEDTDSLKYVETTIWSKGRENILLKHGTVIPVKRIHCVKIY